MIAFLSTHTANVLWKRRAIVGVLLVLLGLSAIVTRESVRELSVAISEKPVSVLVSRMRLEKRGGQLFRLGSDTPFTGWVADYYSTGVLKLRSAVVDGWLEGESVGWFTNGVVELKEHFHHGIPHGNRETWHPNGQKRSEGRLATGQQQGTYRQWDEAGNLVAEAEFDAGKPHGLSLAWYSSGYLKAEALMKHGEIQARHIYSDRVRREPSISATNAAL